MVDSSDSSPVARTAHATRRVESLDADRIRAGAGVVAVAVALAVTAVRLLANGPLSLPLVRPATAFAPLQTLSLLGCAFAAAAIGVVADDAFTRVGLLAAGVFGTLTAAVSVVTVPATGVVAAAGVLVATHPLVRAELVPRRRLPIAFLVAGLVVSLGVGGGVLPTSLRAGGTILALSGLALSPGLGADRMAWVAGGVAAVAVFVVATAAPFVSGAVVLVVGAVVGAPLAFVAAGVGGATALVVGALRRNRYELALAGVLLVAGGVPTTVQRGLAVLVAVALLSQYLDSSTTDRSATDSP